MTLSLIYGIDLYKSKNKWDRVILLLLHEYGYSPIFDPPNVIRPAEPLGNTMTTQLNTQIRPVAQGMYDPQNEHDACGVGFVAHIKGKKSHEIVAQGLKILENLDHRGAVGARSEEHTSELQSH